MLFFSLNKTDRILLRQPYSHYARLILAISDVTRAQTARLQFGLVHAGSTEYKSMLERYKTSHPKPNNIEDLKNVLQVLCDQLPQVSINKAIVSLTKRIRACLKAGVDTLNMLCDKLENIFQFLMKDDVIFILEITNNYFFVCEIPKIENIIIH